VPEELGEGIIDYSEPDRGLLSLHAAALCFSLVFLSMNLVLYAFGRPEVPRDWQPHAIVHAYVILAFLTWFLAC
jgi:hypothetical protein